MLRVALEDTEDVSDDEKNERDDADESVEDDGLAALSALVGHSTVPPPPPDEEEAGASEDDGKLDLRALAASVMPPAPGRRADSSLDDTSLDDDDDEGHAVEEARATVATKSEKKSKKASTKRATAGTAAKKPARATRRDQEDEEEDDGPVVPARTAPTPEPASSNTGAIVIGVGLLAVAAVGIFYVMNNGAGDDGDETIAAAPTNVEPAPNDPSDEVGLEPADENDATPTPIEVAEVVEAEGTPPVDDVGAAETPVPTNVARRAANDPRPVADAPVEVTPPPADPTPPRNPPARTDRPANPPAGGDQSVNNLLDQALGIPNRAAPPPTPPTPPTPARADLPETPSQRDVARALGPVMPQIRQCAGDQVGMANAAIMVRSDGSVASVSVMGNPFSGTPEGACMEGALRGVSFPAFRQSSFTVRYPFNIR